MKILKVLCMISCITIQVAHEWKVEVRSRNVEGNDAKVTKCCRFVRKSILMTMSWSAWMGDRTEDEGRALTSGPAFCWGCLFQERFVKYMIQEKFVPSSKCSLTAFEIPFVLKQKKVPKRSTRTKRPSKQWKHIHRIIFYGSPRVRRPWGVWSTPGTFSPDAIGSQGVTQPRKGQGPGFFAAKPVELLWERIVGMDWREIFVLKKQI